MSKEDRTVVAYKEVDEGNVELSVGKLSLEVSSHLFFLIQFLASAQSFETTQSIKQILAEAKIPRGHFNVLMSDLWYLTTKLSLQNAFFRQKSGHSDVYLLLITLTPSEVENCDL